LLLLGNLPAKFRRLLLDVRQDGLPRDRRELSLRLRLVRLILFLGQRELIGPELLLGLGDEPLVLLLFNLALVALRFELRLLGGDRRARLRDLIHGGRHLRLVRRSLRLARRLDLGEPVLLKIRRRRLLLFGLFELLEVAPQRLLRSLESLLGGGALRRGVSLGSLRLFVRRRRGGFGLLSRCRLLRDDGGRLFGDAEGLRLRLILGPVSRAQLLVKRLHALGV